MSKTDYPVVNVSWEEVEKLAYNIAKKIKKDKKEIDLLVPILRGGAPIALLLSSMLGVSDMACLHIRRSLSDETNADFGIPTNKGITNSEAIKGANILVIDDTLDSKITMDYAIDILKKYKPKSIEIAALYNFNKDTWKEIYSGEEVKKPKWVVFPWEEK